MSIQERARLFRALHTESILVLPNVWDAGSAVVMAQAGAPALATTSGGVAWSLGYGDSQQIGRDAMIDAVRRIASAVEVPVSADIEGGYGISPAEVAATVEAVVSAGAVGINLEDSHAASRTLFGIEEQADRIRAARDAAERSGLPDLVINARTDVYLFPNGPLDERFEALLRRAEAYEKSGADCLFVPGLVDIPVLRELVARSALPVNVMAGPGAPSISDLSGAGVRRVSVGTTIAQAAYTVAQTATAELLQKGTYSSLESALGFAAIDSLFTTGPVSGG